MNNYATYATGGEEVAKYTFFAPASRAILQTCKLVVPRTILQFYQLTLIKCFSDTYVSSIRSTFLPLNSQRNALSFDCTPLRRLSWLGSMNVRKMYRFLEKA